MIRRAASSCAALPLISRITSHSSATFVMDSTPSLILCRTSVLKVTSYYHTIFHMSSERCAVFQKTFGLLAYIQKVPEL